MYKFVELTDTNGFPMFLPPRGDYEITVDGQGHTMISVQGEETSYYTKETPMAAKSAIESALEAMG